MAHTRSIPTDTLGILAQPGTPFVAQIAVTFAILVTKWATRRRTRLALAKLEPWQLNDVGLTRDEAYAEASRVFWRL